jgi:hypothetical protein
MGSVSGTMTLHDRLKQDLAAALATRDLETARVLRTLVAAIDNAAAVAPGAGPRDGRSGRRTPASHR